MPPVVGAIEYRRKGGASMTLGILEQFVPNAGDAWNYTLDSLSTTSSAPWHTQRHKA